MKSLANAVGAKTARACDSCVKRRARWYCAADDAFLCQSCDGLVHSANLLARRHERFRLKTSSQGAVKHRDDSDSPTWHHGITRKPRTPRGKKSQQTSVFHHDLVPEISVEDQIDSYEQEEQLICQVPDLDPMVAEQFLNDVDVETKIEFPTIKNCVMIHEDEEDNTESCLNSFFPTDMELEEFASGVESLFGRGLDNESYPMEELRSLSHSEMFKIEKDEIEEEEKDVPLELRFDFESNKTYDEEEAKKNIGSTSECLVKVEVKKEEEQKKVLMLRLNYDLVISTWRGQSPPWSTIDPPELDIDMTSWPVVSMGEIKGETHQKKYVNGGGCLNSSGLDGGREARVSRYREKRRTRLFSKKIRYEVRKLNAEKRPRMKGRFVKRTSLVAANSPLGVNY